MSIQIRDSYEPPAEFTEPQEEGQNFRRYVDLMWRRKWLVISVAIAVTLFGLLLTLRQKSIYSSSTSLVITSKAPPSIGSDLGAMVMGTVSGVESQNIATQVAIISSPDMMLKAYNRLRNEIPTGKEHINGKKDIKDGFLSAPKPPAWSFAVQAGRDTQLITVKTEAYTGQAAADFAYEIAQTYMDNDLEMTSGAANKGRLFIGSRLAAISNELQKATQDLSAYSTTSGMVVPESDTLAASNELHQLESTKQKAEIDLASAQASARTLSSEIRSQHPTIRSSQIVTDNPVFSHMTTQVAELQDKLNAALKEYQPDAPK